MKTKFGAFALSTALLLAAGACSKKDEPAAGGTGSTTTTAAAAGSTTTTKADSGSTTTKASGDSTTTKASGSKTPPKPKDLDLTSSEEACINGAFENGLTSDPSMAENELKMAGFTGGVIAGCVDKDKIAAAIIKLVKQANPDAKESVLECAKTELVKFDTSDLGVVIAGILLQEKELLTEADAKIKAKCPGA